MKLQQIEFSGLPDGEVEVRDQGKVFQLTTQNYEFIDEFIDLLKSKRKIAYSALEKRYIKSKANHSYYKFLIVRGFIKCNFIMLDNHMDIDENGNFNTEFVLCPRTGECLECGLVCNSPANTELSEREIQVLRLIAVGKENVTIADELYISAHTVHNHRNNILKKLGKNNTAELVSYWYKSNLK